MTSVRAPRLDPEGLRHNLRMILSLLADLHILSIQAHGHLVTANCLPVLQMHVDNIIHTARDATDTIAERLRALESTSGAASATQMPVAPPGERTTAAMLDRITHRMVTVVDIIGHIHQRVDADDSVTADLLQAITEVFDEQTSILMQRLKK